MSINSWENCNLKPNSIAIINLYPAHFSPSWNDENTPSLKGFQKPSLILYYRSLSTLTHFLHLENTTALDEPPTNFSPSDLADQAPIVLRRPFFSASRRPLFSPPRRSLRELTVHESSPFTVLCESSLFIVLCDSSPFFILADHPEQGFHIFFSSVFSPLFNL